jgi:hypothetical protein
MRRKHVTIAALSATLLSSAALVLLVPGSALGTIYEIGVVTQVGATSATGTSGVSGVSGTSGVSGATGTTGTTSSLGVPSCPGTPCLAVSETTGFTVKIGKDRSVLSIPHSGSIVAWTITLGDPTAAQTTYFDDDEGGPASAGIAILKAGKGLDFTLVAQGPIVPLQKYFGETAQFPLPTSIKVKKHEIVALEVPTWAPSLALGYPATTSWRASRPKKGCTTTATQTAQQTIGSAVQYACLYQTARLTYSATLVTTP